MKLLKSPKYQENVEDGRIWHGCADRESSLQGILLWLMVDHNNIDKSVVNNEFCKIDGGNNCYERPIGKNLEAGYCSKIKKQDINLDSSN